MNVFRTKSVEQSIAETDEPEHQAQEEPRRPRPDRLRGRRHHRRRHLRPHRHRRRHQLRARDRALLRHRRRRVRARRALLRRVRLDGAGRRQRLHVQLRHLRRAGRLDHRLGPGARVHHRRRRRSRPASPATSRRSLDGTPLEIPTALASAEDGVVNLPAVLIALAGDDGADPRHQVLQPAQPGRRRDQARRRRCSSSSSASATSRPTNYSPFIPPAEPTPEAAGGFLDVPLISSLLRPRARRLRRRRRRRRRGGRVLRLHRLRHRRHHRRGDARTRSATSRAASSARWPSSPLLYMAVSLVITGMQNYPTSTPRTPRRSRPPSTPSASTGWAT